MHGALPALRVAVVTPYHGEPAAVLRRCMHSVRAQDHPHVVHYMVADGLPQPALLAEWPQVRHIPLPHGNANFGCTPRGIGALCALADGADVVCFLDADNLFLPGHVASVVQAYAEARARGRPVDAVFSSRHMFLPGREDLRIVPPDEAPGSEFVDTNCISLARSAGENPPSGPIRMAHGPAGAPARASITGLASPASSQNSSRRPGSQPASSLSSFAGERISGTSSRPVCSAASVAMIRRRSSRVWSA